jgi:hypothetical protein
MEVTLQHVLDALSERVGRPAVLEDRFMRLIAYSAHDDRVDDVREDSILRRHASPEVASWLSGFGLPRIRRPLRVPGNPELHMLPRVCIPVLYRDKLFGFLWFVDSDGSMSASNIEICVRDASELADQLHRESVASRFSAARVADAMHALLTDSPLAVEAARNLTEAGDISADDGIVALVVEGVAGTRSDEIDIDDALAQAMADFRRLVRRGQAVELIRRDHGVILLPSKGDDDPSLAERVDLVLELARASVAASGGAASGGAASLIAGVGGWRASLDEAAQSFREARMSVDAARVLPGMGEIVYWTRLGIHQIVAKLATMDEQMPVVHSGLRRLLGDPEALPLLETLETYLDVAGSAQLTAERLNLHRTSLYYRLQRIEQLADTDLKNGVERLALHLSLKVARMTGQYAPRSGDGAPADRSLLAPPVTSLG